MSSKKETLEVVLQKNENRNSQAYGKWYGKCATGDKLDIKGLARHIKSHGSVYDESDIAAVVAKAAHCIVELCAHNTRVVLDELGTFYPSITSEGVSTPQDFSCQQHVKGVHLRFLPWGEKGDDNITSKAFKDKVTMHATYYQTGTQRQKNIKLTPIAQEGQEPQP